jgi:hypothetical protein
MRVAAIHLCRAKLHCRDHHYRAACTIFLHGRSSSAILLDASGKCPLMSLANSSSTRLRSPDRARFLSILQLASRRHIQCQSNLRLWICTSEYQWFRRAECCPSFDPYQIVCK